MTRLLIWATAAFLLGLAGGVGTVLARGDVAAPSAAEPPADEKADSADMGDAVDGGDPDPASGEDMDDPSVSVESPESEGDVDLSPESRLAETLREDSPVTSLPSDPGRSGAGSGETAHRDRDGENQRLEAARRLANIFSSMDARDAAQVLEQLEDGELASILIHMGTRQAAAILRNIEPDRAASLSRLVISGGVSGP